MKSQKKKIGKFKFEEIAGIQWVKVSSYEEEQEALKQGFQNILYSEKPTKRKGPPKKGPLSGRTRHERYGGIFQVK